MAEVLRISVPGYRYQLKAAIHGAGHRTQREFAESAGIDVAELSRIMHGLNPTKPCLRKMADALSLTVGEFKRLL
jgi:predicted transcriptional regulator